VLSKSLCSHVRVYNDCCAGVHNTQFEAIEHSLCIASKDKMVNGLESVWKEAVGPLLVQIFS
jgi:hypothetical protein